MFFESYHFLKIIKQKCQKTEFRRGHLGFWAAILDWQWVLDQPVLYVWYDNLYQFSYFYHKVNDRYTICHILPFFIMQIGSSYFRIIPLILNQFCKNLVHIYKMHSWTILFLYSIQKSNTWIFKLFKEKQIFDPLKYTHISKDRNSYKYCSIDQVFFLHVQEIPIQFFFFCSSNFITF